MRRQSSTSSFASSASNQSSSPGGSEATRGLRTRRRPQPAFPSPVSTSSTARPSVQLLQVARRLGGYTQCARAPPLSRRTPRPRPAGPCAPQPADSASASSALDVTVGFINSNEDPPPNFSKLPGGSEATSSGGARAPPLSRRTPRPRLAPSTSSSASSSTTRPSTQIFQVARRLHPVGALARPHSAGGLRVRARQGPAPLSRWTPRPRPAPSTSPSASSTTARPSAQLFQVARRLGGYTQWVRSHAPTRNTPCLLHARRRLQPASTASSTPAKNPPRNFSKLPGGSEATVGGMTTG
ncbi:hypothetical protein VPH35_007422 [Triticum aestivum]